MIRIRARCDCAVLTSQHALLRMRAAIDSATAACQRREIRARRARAAQLQNTLARCCKTIAVECLIPCAGGSTQRLGCYKTILRFALCSCCSPLLRALSVGFASDGSSAAIRAELVPTTVPHSSLLLPLLCCCLCSESHASRCRIRTDPLPHPQRQRRCAVQVTR